jgi:hypothetical protein
MTPVGRKVDAARECGITPRPATSVAPLIDAPGPAAGVLRAARCTAATNCSTRPRTRSATPSASGPVSSRKRSTSSGRRPCAASASSGRGAGGAGRGGRGQRGHWLTAHRGLACGYERDPAVSEAMIRWARDQHHHPTHRLRRPRSPATTAHLPESQLIFPYMFSACRGLRPLECVADPALAVLASRQANSPAAGPHPAAFVGRALQPHAISSRTNTRPAA